MKSIWTETAERPSFEAMSGDVKTDVLVIGGGIAGILTAYQLKQAGVDCVVAEADRICCGVTENTTAKLTVQHGLIYHRLIREFGIEKAKLYLESQSAALERYRGLCAEIPCDFEERDSYVYSVGDRRKIERELRALERLGCNAEFSPCPKLPFAVAGAVRIPRQGQFHPLKLIYALAKDLTVYENTRVLELYPDGARTDRGRIFAKRMVIATHFPFLNKHGWYFLKMYQHRSYVLELESAPDLDGMYVDEDKRGLSFRSYKGRLLLGGGGHRTGKRGGGWESISEFAKHYYPNAWHASRWATQDCMTLDGIPYIGRYANGTQNLYVATGFNKWGMTSSMVAASLLTDLVQGKKNSYEMLYSPSRSILRPQLAVNAAEALLGWITPTVPRCPHLGCALKYNPQEHSWDCPCHGSRFSQDGKLLDNPSTGDLER